MNENKLINNGSSYEYIRQLEQHSKQYDYVSDKKSFLKSIVPYEQKLVLLNSKNPYQVLEYLDELDIKATRDILNNLTYDEIKNILSLFSSEDKKRFYTRYSDLGLVNQFIKYDNNSLEYVDDLTFDRKVKIIDSSNSKTVEATAKVYSTMTTEQQDMVSDFITNTSASSTLDVVEAQAETNNVEIIAENEETNIIPQQLTEEIVEVVEEKLEETKQKEELEKEQNYKEELQKEIENQEQSQEKTVETAPNEQLNDGSEILEMFQQAKSKNEAELIKIVQNSLNQQQAMEPIEVDNSIKTI